jgi:hypothetical protein
MKLRFAGLLLGAATAAMVGCASHQQYYAPPPPPPPAYTQPIIHAAETNGFADGEREGQRDRYQGHNYRPRHSDRYEDTPGYYAQLGGNLDQYRYYYRDGYIRGYHYGYTHNS